MSAYPPFGILGKRRTPRTPRVLVAVAIALLVLVAYLLRAPLGSLLWQVLGPVMGARSALFSTEALALRAELSQQGARLADRDALYQENIELKRLLNRAAGRAVTIAGVLQRPPGTPYDTLVVDLGRQQGAVVGSLVSMGGSALVGVITEVMESASRVTLFSSPGQVHDGVLMVGEVAVAVSVEGQGGGSLRAQVPAGSGARVGDTVRLPGVGMGLVAEVRQVHARAGESFETIYFSLPADLNARYVEIWQ